MVGRFAALQRIEAVGLGDKRHRLRKMPNVGCGILRTSSLEGEEEEKWDSNFFCLWSLLHALVHPVLAAKLIFTLHSLHPVSLLFGKSSMAPSGLQSEVQVSLLVI